MKLPFYHIDSFANSVFSGNPAGVCPLDRWIDDGKMQAVAAENNLSETAFFVRDGEDYALRWFTPACEMDLCGHATLASALIVFTRLEPERSHVRFTTRSGILEVSRDGDRLAMDFPAWPASPCIPSPGMIAALGVEPDAVLAGERDYLAVYPDVATVRALAPDADGLMKLDRHAVIVTAPGEDCDFVSRFFAPKVGIYEDPVTGSAHCTLVPYWSERLGKTNLFARQVSARGGALWCEDRGERVRIAGHAVVYLEGEITL